MQRSAVFYRSCLITATVVLLFLLYCTVLTCGEAFIITVLFCLYLFALLFF